MSADREKSRELALMQVGDEAPLQQKGQVGVNHLAFMMESLDDLKEAYLRLKEKNVKIDRIAHHGVSLGIYFHDPVGNGRVSVTWASGSNGRLSEGIVIKWRETGGPLVTPPQAIGLRHQPYTRPHPS